MVLFVPRMNRFCRPEMSSSSSDDYRMYRRLFPVHDAVELGDLEALTRMLRPRKVDAGLTTPVIACEGAIGNSNNNPLIKVEMAALWWDISFLSVCFFQINSLLELGFIFP